MQNQLYIYNSLSKKKELFKSIVPYYVGMYVCGPTVYSNVHLGNCRTFISFDVIFRYLKYLGYKVRYVRNITDVGHLENDADEGEDRISKKARLEKIEPMEVAQKYTSDFHTILNKFNCLPPSIEPTATGHIIEQIETIQQILKQGFAYEVNGSVYFDVLKFNKEKGYGKLSGRNIEDLIHNTRTLGGQDDKKNPQDFALWKKAEPNHIMRWDSPWSEGFPGWHLECTAMSTKYLGTEFDIHGGGMDLKFPHHECEIAQAESINKKSPVNYWIHTNMLTLNGQKMAKSTGNNILPNDIFMGDTTLLSKNYVPTVVRFFMLQAHYRSILDISDDALLSAEKGYKRLMEALQKLENISTSASTNGFDVQKWLIECYSFMNDDFNTPMLIANLFEAVKFIKKVKANQLTISEEDKLELIKHLRAFIFEVLGLEKMEESSSGADSNNLSQKLIECLIDIRNEARAQKNFETSDKIRDRLLEAGVELKDEKNQTKYSILE